MLIYFVFRCVFFVLLLPVFAFPAVSSVRTSILTTCVSWLSCVSHIRLWISVLCALHYVEFANKAYYQSPQTPSLCCITPTLIQSTKRLKSFFFQLIVKEPTNHEHGKIGVLFCFFTLNGKKDSFKVLLWPFWKNMVGELRVKTNQNRSQNTEDDMSAVLGSEAF